MEQCIDRDACHTVSSAEDGAYAADGCAVIGQSLYSLGDSTACGCAGQKQEYILILDRKSVV